MIMMVVGFSRWLGGFCGSGFLTAKEPGAVDIYIVNFVLIVEQRRRRVGSGGGRETSLRLRR